MAEPIELPASMLALVDDQDRLASLLAQRHADYTAHEADWREQIDAFQASGGYRDGAYLWAFPREAHADFVRRQAMARYHNLLAPICDLYVRLLSSRSSNRSSRDPELNVWLTDVNGAGQSIDEFLRDLISLSLVTGHSGVLVDRTSYAPTGPTRSDDPNRVIVSAYSSLSIADWSFDGPRLTSVKLLETPSGAHVLTDRQTAPAVQYLVVESDGWARLAADGTVLAGGRPELGTVPFFVYRAQPLYTSRMLGRALVDAGVLRAHFNRCSEEDQVLRDQAFSVLTVSVPPDGDVTQAREQIGSSLGTTSALIVQGQVSYQTPDQSVPKTIRDKFAFLTADIYRSAHVRFAADGREAESGESIRLQHAELNEVLSSMARSLGRLEQQIVRAYYHWTQPTARAAEQALAASEFTVSYPEEFFETDTLRDLEAWAEAIRMDLGPTMSRHLKKKAVRRLDGEMSAEILTQVDREIEAQREPGISDPLDFGDPEGAGITRAAAA